MEMYDLQTLVHRLHLVALISKEILNSEKSSEIRLWLVGAQSEAAFAHFLQQQLFQNC